MEEKKRCQNYIRKIMVRKKREIEFWEKFQTFSVLLGIRWKQLGGQNKKKIVFVQFFKIQVVQVHTFLAH